MLERLHVKNFRGLRDLETLMAAPINLRLAAEQLVEKRAFWSLVRPVDAGNPEVR